MFPGRPFSPILQVQNLINLFTFLKRRFRSVARIFRSIRKHRARLLLHPPKINQLIHIRKDAVFFNRLRLLTKISTFDQILIFEQHFYFLTKFFVQNLDFWPKFRPLIKILTFDQNSDFRARFRFFVPFF